MNEFLTLALSFPTIVFSGALIIVVLYWGFVIVGALDVALLDPTSQLEGLGEGAAEGAAEGLAEGAAEGLAEGAAEGLAEGAAEGLAEGGTEGLAEGAASAVAVASVSPSAMAAMSTMGTVSAGPSSLGTAADGLSLMGLVSSLGLRRAPVTVVLSFSILVSWAFSYLGALFLTSIGSPFTHWGFGILVLGASFVASLPVAGMLSRPLGPLFLTQTAPRRTDIVGTTCTIITGYVDDVFGEARVGTGGHELLVPVRCRPGGRLSKGQEALIVDYDAARELYYVEAFDWGDTDQGRSNRSA
ncbi:MAG: hypothetical protein IPK13_04115 [Deltaproteobacteria bacterium]|nr:hypothetical protein [Deltaproteobacteria bacterium]